MDAAKALTQRTGENPAAWRGNFKHLLPSPGKPNRMKGASVRAIWALQAWADFIKPRKNTSG